MGQPCSLSITNTFKQTVQGEDHDRGAGMDDSTGSVRRSAKRRSLPRARWSCRFQPSQACNC